MGSKASGNRSGQPRAPGAGRPPVKATVRQGDGVMLTHVTPGGTADLGRGVATVTAVGRSRLITVAQGDGTEIRILVVSSPTPRPRCAGGEMQR